MTKSQQPWSVPLRLDDVPDTGRHVELRADDAVRAAVARAANVLEIVRLEAAFDVSRHGQDGLHVVGNISARVRQACVVTLEPLEDDITESIDLVFAPVPNEILIERPNEEASLAAVEPPEPLVDGAVDLGALAAEFLILGIDPYPRKAGAVFEPPPSSDPGTKPFAALARLRTPPVKR